MLARCATYPPPTLHNLNWNPLGNYRPHFQILEIPDAKGHQPKHTSSSSNSNSNINEVFKQPNKSRTKTHYAVPPILESEDDDGQPSSSAEDYDMDSDPHNLYTKPTRTSSQNGFHHTHNNNARYNNVPLFGPGAGGASASNGGIVTHTEVRGTDNDVSNGIGSTASYNCYSCCYKLFSINLSMLIFTRLFYNR